MTCVYYFPHFIVIIFENTCVYEHKPLDERSLKPEEVMPGLSGYKETALSGTTRTSKEQQVQLDG